MVESNQKIPKEKENSGNPMIKYFRLGHRTPKNGVITIASEVKDSKIFYGISYCSPKETRYDKKLGYSIALERVEEKIKNDIYIDLVGELTHYNIVETILTYLYYFVSENRNDWTDKLYEEYLEYPLGLKTYSNSCDYSAFDIITEIVVSSEEKKEQLLLASAHLLNLCGIDSPYMAVDSLIRLYNCPEKIIVR